VPALKEEPQKLTKRERTRRKLLTATRDLIYDRGIERVAILEITDAAGVAAGSFYNYFENKTAIVAAIVDDFHEVFESHLSETRTRLKDPAMRLSVSLKYFFAQSQENEAWRSFIISAGLSDQQVLAQSARQCRDDIALGTRGGRFKTENVAITQSLITGMATHVALEIQRGRLPRTAVFETVRHILRMLGLPDIAAKAFAYAPLPTISAPVRTDFPTDSSIPFHLAIERRKLSRDREQATAAS
jgi:AcrR family transcriptional regulator|tara:strand:- start:417 stop:1148 length:732 start_codon:yes stop_codon:yes gene_type:complete